MTPPWVSFLVLPLVGYALLISGIGALLWMFRRWGRIPYPLQDRTQAVSVWTRALQALLGVVFLYGLCAVFHLLALWGAPVDTSLALEPIEGSPAERAGIEPGDVAVRANGRALERFEDLQHEVEQSDGIVALEFEREGRSQRVSVEKGEGGRIGVVPLPGPPRAVQLALREALVAPAKAIFEDVAEYGVLFTGSEAVVTHSFGRGTERMGRKMLAWRASQMLFELLVVYLVVLMADARSRVLYHCQREVPS